MRKITDKFQAIGADGKIYTVVETKKEIVSRPLQGPVLKAYVAEEYQLSSGGYVNWKDENTFEIAETGEIIRRN